jgi:hypothetical protein
MVYQRIDIYIFTLFVVLLGGGSTIMLDGKTWRYSVKKQQGGRTTVDDDARVGLPLHLIFISEFSLCMSTWIDSVQDQGMRLYRQRFLAYKQCPHR